MPESTFPEALADTLDAIDRILDVEDDVEVRGVKLPLRVPSAANVRESRRLVAQTQNMSDEEAIEFSLTIGLTVIRAVTGASEDQAARLFVASGGERGKLYAKAFEMCGLDFRLADAAEAAEVDDPTS